MRCAPVRRSCGGRSNTAFATGTGTSCGWSRARQSARLRTRELLEEALELFALEAREKDVRLELHCAPSLERTELFTDPQRLRQVLINLVGNAVKFTDRGSVSMSVSEVWTDDRRSCLRCEIV